MNLETLRRSTAAALCLECGKCSTLCPLAAFGGYSASRVAAIRDPGGEIGSEIGSEIERRAGAVERCLTCAACEIRCPQGVRFSDFVRGLRPAIPDELRHPCPHGEALQAAARLMASDATIERDLSWVDDDLRVAEEGELALFVGCLPLFDAMFEEELGVTTLDIARSAIRLLNDAGIEPVLLGEERCCGHDLLWSGEEEGFRALAKANAGAFAAKGVRTILTTCAECCRTWRLDYPGVTNGYRPRVLHLAEFLAGRLEAEEAEPRPAVDGTVTFHDPCRLGRHLGVFEEPRRLLRAAGTRFVEMEHHGEDGVCCGSPGFIRCDAASRALQTERLEGAVATGADRMLTACPKCLIHFTCAQREDRLRRRDRRPIEIEDLTVFVADRLAPPRASAPAASEPQQGEAP